MVSLGLGASLSLRQYAGPFNPASLFGPSDTGAFYDPSDLSTLRQNSNGTTAVAVGDPVGYMADKSGKGNHATQATAANRPILRQDGGGLYYLEFDGTNDLLRALFTVAQPWDRVSSMQQISWTANEHLFGGGSANFGILFQSAISPEIKINDGSSVTNGGAAVGANVVVSERHNNTSSSLTVNSTTTSGTTGTGVPGGITIGANYLDGGASNIRLYGLLMIGRALSAGELSQARIFMASLAGVTL